MNDTRQPYQQPVKGGRGLTGLYPLHLNDLALIDFGRIGIIAVNYGFSDSSILQWIAPNRALVKVVGHETKGIHKKEPQRCVGRKEHGPGWHGDWRWVCKEYISEIVKNHKRMQINK